MTTSADALIVEDEPVVLLVAGKALAAYGISYVESTDYQSAADALSDSTFKLVLTDLKLPGASGFAVIELALTLSPPPEVIAITGYATIEHALESFQAGAFDFLPKPFDVDELITVVERALRYHDRRQRPAPETRATSAGPDEVLSLGRHSWARLDTDGTAVLGVGETLAGVTGPLESIEWSSTDGQTVQGATCALLIDENGQKHRVRAPLSGDILTTNSTLEVEPNRLASEPSSDGWLLRIIPDNLEQEASRLHRRQRVGDD